MYEAFASHKFSIPPNTLKQWEHHEMIQPIQPTIQQYFSPTTNQETVISAIAFQPSQQYRN
jgi:hypothetical protein